MKKYLLPLLVLFLAASNSATAQQFAQDSVNVTDVTTDDSLNNFAYAFIHFYNTSSSSVRISWELIYDTVPPSWQFGICDNNQCYYNNPVTLLDKTHATSPIAAGDSMSFEAEISPYCDSGTGILKISANLSSGGIDTLIFVVKINTECTASAVVDLSNNIKPVQLFPNPAQENVTVGGLALNNHVLQIDILNTQGQALQSYRRVNNSQLTFNCQNLPAGVYLMRITDLQDGSVNMGKFSKL